jgi:hypothetical protein
MAVEGANSLLAIPDKTLSPEEINIINNIGNVQAAAGFETVTTTNTNSREELLNKVATEEELLGILDKLRVFTESFPCDITSGTDFSNGVVTTEPEGSVKICYMWEPSQIVKEKYSVLMLKFIDSSNELMKKKIDYAISITHGLDPVFTKIGSTSTGVDLKIIDENTFSTDSAINPINYDMNIAIPSVDDIPINEYTRPLRVNVVS